MIVVPPQDGEQNSAYRFTANTSTMKRSLPVLVALGLLSLGIVTAQQLPPGQIVRRPADVARLVKDARSAKGPIFRVVKVMTEKLELVMPPQDGALLKDRFRRALLGPAG